MEDRAGFVLGQELSEAGVANGGAAKAGADADTNMDVHTGVATAMLADLGAESRPADQLYPSHCC